MMVLGSTISKTGGFWRRHDRGSVAILFALAMPIVAAGAALGLEAGVWYYDKLKLQQVADAAAYAAAVDNREGSSASVMTTDATTAAKSCLCGTATSDCSSLCVDQSVPQAFITLTATDTYTGPAGTVPLSAQQTIRVR